MQNYLHLGYIKVNEFDPDPDIDGVISTVYIKVNKIATIDCLGEEGDRPYNMTRICMQGDESFCYDVKETAEEIFTQIEGVHPSLR